MANELIESGSFGVKYTPAILEMERFDDMEEAIKVFADKYDGLTFTADEKQGASAARSELISIRDAIETERKNVKKEYNKPLKKFETKAKSLVSMIDKPLDNIRDGLKVIETAERERRNDILMDYIGKESAKKNVAPEELEYSLSWTNATNFTSKYQPTAKLKEEIAAAIDNLAKENEHKEAQKKILIGFCEAKDIDPSGWIAQLEYRSATEIMDSINADIQRKKEVEQLKIERDRELKKAEEKAAETKGSNKEETFQHSFPLPDQDEVEDDSIQSLEDESKGLITNRIEVTGTVEQLNDLNKFLVANGIKVKQIEDEFIVDDLPF